MQSHDKTILAWVLSVSLFAAVLIIKTYYFSMAYEFRIDQVKYLMDNSEDVKRYVIDRGFLDDKMLSDYECDKIEKKYLEIKLDGMKL